MAAAGLRLGGALVAARRRVEALEHDFMIKVVIVGGGFGGVRAALKLSGHSEVEVKLIAENTYFEYHAALYRSATGRSPLEVAIPLQNFFAKSKNIEVVQDKVETIDTKARHVVGASGSRWNYDKLILATGSVTAYFGIKGLKRYSHGVKSIHEALELKRHLHDTLVSGHAESNYVVIGGGATGVELSAELTAYISSIRRRHHLLERPFAVSLVEAAERVVPQLPLSYSARIQRRLQKLGVNLYLKTPVTAETYESIKLPGGSIHTHTVIWTAGVTNNPLFAKHDFFKLGRGQKVSVDKHLQAHEDIYVIGDSAETEFSGMAQTALHDANFVADNLLRQLHGRPLKTYQAKRPIYAIPVGPRWSAIRWGRAEIYGYPGWILRRLADLRLYLKFLPLGKALTTWRFGITIDENCPICSS